METATGMRECRAVRTVLGALLGLFVVLSPLVCMTNAVPLPAVAQEATEHAGPGDGLGGDAPCSEKGVAEQQSGARADTHAPAPSLNKPGTTPVAHRTVGGSDPVAVCGPAPPPPLSVLRI